MGIFERVLCCHDFTRLSSPMNRTYEGEWNRLRIENMFVFRGRPEGLGFGSDAAVARRHLIFQREIRVMNCEVFDPVQ
jgi:hypothetical protein